MGSKHQANMKTALVLLALVSMGFAHMTEPESAYNHIDPPPGEEDSLALIEEDAGAVTKLRVTWKTKANPCLADGSSCAVVQGKNKKNASGASFKITITGAGGNVEDEVFKHPGEVKDSDGCGRKQAQAWFKLRKWTPRRTLARSLLSRSQQMLAMTKPGHRPLSKSTQTTSTLDWALESTMFLSIGRLTRTTRLRPR